MKERRLSDLKEQLRIPRLLNHPESMSCWLGLGLRVEGLGV